MPEYRSESEERTGTLAPGEQLAVEFTPGGSGTVQVHATAPPGASVLPYPDPVGRRVELIAPDESRPVASTSEPGFGGTTVVTSQVSSAQASSGPWTARVTNADEEFDHAAQAIETQDGEFTLSVVYPGDTRIFTHTVSASAAESLLASQLEGTEITLTSGTDASVVRLPESVGGAEYRFTVPDFERSIQVAFTSLQIRLGANDINSQQIKADLRSSRSGFPNGSLRLRVPFEEQGREITGTFNVQLRDLRLQIDLGLTVQDGQITYSRDGVHVETSFDADVEAIPPLIEQAQVVSDAKRHVNQRVKRRIEREVRAVFARDDVHRGITDAITAQVRDQIPSSVELLGVEVTGGQVHVRYALA